MLTTVYHVICSEMFTGRKGVANTALSESQYIAEKLWRRRRFMGPLYFQYFTRIQYYEYDFDNFPSVQSPLPSPRRSHHHRNYDPIQSQLKHQFILTPAPYNESIQNDLDIDFKARSSPVIISEVMKPVSPLPGRSVNNILTVSNKSEIVTWELTEV